MMKRYSIVCLMLVCACLMGCSARRGGLASFGTVGNLEIRYVGSDNQEHGPNVVVNIQTDLPIVDLPIPVHVTIDSAAVSSDLSVYAEVVEGTATIEVIGSGNQNTKGAEVKTDKEHVLLGSFESYLSK